MQAGLVKILFFLFSSKQQQPNGLISINHASPDHKSGWVSQRYLSKLSGELTSKNPIDQSKKRIPTSDLFKGNSPVNFEKSPGETLKPTIKVFFFVLVLFLILFFCVLFPPEIFLPLQKHYLFLYSLLTHNFLSLSFVCLISLKLKDNASLLSTVSPFPLGFLYC
uniref:Uncharacterized protein n=1 Tax=Cacopsylla melanoneura TaxID=428564 RepID=A0A8D9DW38_9HEMI